MDKREIKGEIESYSREPRELRNGMGSRGIKVDGDWHNKIGHMEKLKELDLKFPKGTKVTFKEKKNPKGYWDIEGELERANEVDYGMNSPEAKEKSKGLSGYPPEPDRQKDILLQVAFKGAVEVVKAEMKKTEGVIEIDSCYKRILDGTEKLYKGMKEKKLQLQEAGDY